MTISYEYDQDIETIFQLLTDPQFLVDRSLAIGELGAECEVEGDEESLSIALTREVERDLPGFLAKVFDPNQTLNQAEEWYINGDGYEGEWTITIVGQPVAISGVFSLEPVGSGCRYTVKHSAKAKIPLIGKQVEKYVLGQTAGVAEEELEYLGSQLV